MIYNIAHGFYTKCIQKCNLLTFQFHKKTTIASMESEEKDSIVRRLLASPL